MEIFQLTSEDLSNLGGPMGTESTTTNFSKPFSTLEKAQKYASRDYTSGKIEWRKNGRNKWTSGDLAYVMYSIEKIKVL